MTQPARSLLREAFAAAGQYSKGADHSNQSSQPSRVASSSDLRRTVSPVLKVAQRSCSASVMQPVAAEIQAILKGHLRSNSSDDDACHVFGCSPPPRDCTNALVRDSSFSSMGYARPLVTANSCSTAWHLANLDGCGSSCSLSCMSPPVSALRTA